MAKMRVNELARELGIENKQIIEFLSTTEHAVKSHSSNVDDEVQALVRTKFAKGAKQVAPQEKKSAPKQSEQKKAESAEERGKETAKPGKAENAPKDAAGTRAKEDSTERQERPKKKSSITAVFNAQYSKQGTSHGGRKNNRPSGGDRRVNNGSQNDRRANGGGGGKPQQRPQSRPVSGYDVRKAFDLAINPEAVKAAEAAERQAAERAAAAREAAAKEAAERQAAEAAKAQKRPNVNVYGNVYENVYANNTESRPSGSERRHGQF